MSAATITTTPGNVETRCPSIFAALRAHGLALNDLPRRMPHLLDSLEEIWGSAHAISHLDQLIFSDREARAGFDATVLAELMLLRNILEADDPSLMGDENDPYNHVRSAAMREQLSRIQIEASTQGKSTPQSDSTVTPALEREASDHAIHTLSQLETALRQPRSADSSERQRLGELLVTHKFLRPEVVDVALEQQLKAPSHSLLGQLLLDIKAIDDEQLNLTLAIQRGVPIVDAVAVGATPEAIRLVPIRVARLKKSIPLAVVDKRLIIAVADPFDSELREYFSFVSGCSVELVFSTPRQIIEAQTGYEQAVAGDDTSRGLATLSFQEPTDAPADDDFATGPLLDAQVDEDDETVIGMVNKVIHDAIRLGASDIHFEAFPRTRNGQIRLRRDGVMGVHSEYPIAYHAAIVSRLKIMADLNIAEKRIGQDGKIAFGQSARKLDLRVSVIPTNNALEIVTVRLLSSGKPLPLTEIGMHPATLKAFRREFEKPHGLILVCGPTGSGKTTTLHSVLAELNTPQRKIWTAEDPVEIVQRNVSQVQVHHKIGWSFAQALRCFLRADPDVIMIGEIRDLETAQATIEASMTGHLVLSTLHTNSAAETLSRLLDLEVPAFNLADAILAVLAQRLARKLCTECAERHEFISDELDALATEYLASSAGKAPSMADRTRLLTRWYEEFGEAGKLYGRHRIGCRACSHSGYRGRLGLHELMVESAELRRLIRANAGTGEIQHQAIADGMKTLKQDGIEKVVKGLTDLTEVRTVCV